MCVKFQITETKQQQQHAAKIVDSNSPTKSTSVSYNNINSANNREKRIITNGTLQNSITSSTTENQSSQSPQQQQQQQRNNQYKQPNLLSPTKLIPIKMLNNNGDLISKITNTSSTNHQQMPSCVPALNSLMNKLNNYQQQHVLPIVTTTTTTASSFSTSSNSSSGSSSTSSSTSSFKLTNQVAKELSLSPVIKLQSIENKLNYNIIPTNIQQQQQQQEVCINIYVA